MKFFRDTFNFFRREPKWAFLLALVLVILALVELRSGEMKEKGGQPHPALRKFEQAENRLKDEISSMGGIEKYLKKRPKLFWALRFLSFGITGVLVWGLVLDFFWFTRPGFRSRIQVSTGPPEARSWGLSAVLKTVLLFIMGSVGLSLLLGILKWFPFRQADSNFLILLHTTLSDILCVGLVIYFIPPSLAQSAKPDGSAGGRRYGGDWRDLWFRNTRFWKDIWVGIQGYLVVLPLFIAALVLLLVVVQLFSVEPPPHPLVEVFLEEEKSPLITAYSIFLACIVGPFLEEIFFRGFCYPALKNRWGQGWALVLSSAFFAAIHQNLFAFIPVFILGLALGYLYEKRGTLLPSITLHILHNSVFILYFFLAKEVLTRGS